MKKEVEFIVLLYICQYFAEHYSRKNDRDIPV